MFRLEVTQLRSSFSEKPFPSFQNGKFPTSSFLTSKFFQHIISHIPSTKLSYWDKRLGSLNQVEIDQLLVWLQLLIAIQKMIYLQFGKLMSVQPVSFISRVGFYYLWMVLRIFTDLENSHQKKIDILDWIYLRQLYVKIIQTKY